MEMTTLYNKYFGQSVKTVKERPKILASQLIVLFCALILGHSSIFDNLSPFALSFLCAVPSYFSFSALVGACFGYMTKQSGIMLIRYIASAITLWVISNKIIGRVSKYNDIWFLYPVISTVISFVLGVAVLLPKGLSFNGIWIFVSEALLCGVSTYFLRKTFSIKNTSNKKICLTHSELVCVIASIAIFLMSLSFLQLRGIMLSRIIASIIVMISAYYAKESGGCIVGITASASLCFTNDNPYAIFIFAFGGLLCGVFSSLGRIATAAAYIVASSILYIIAGGEINMAVLLLESITGAFIFLIVPSKYMDKLQKYFHVTFKTFSNDIVKKDITTKLMTASKAVNEVSSNIIHISDGLKRINYNDEKSIYCYVREDICSRCPKEEFCWQDNFSTMIKNFDYYLHLFKEREYVTENDVPIDIANQCDKSSILLASFKSNYARYISTCEEEKDINNLRNMLSDQLSCMSNVLKNFADDFEKQETMDYETAGEIKQIFSNHYIDANKIVCCVDSKGKMKIIAQCKKIERGVKKEILVKEIECLTLRKFEMPIINFSENGIIITIKQKPWMKLAVGSMQYPSEGNTLCGDYFDKISYDDGKETFIISDGMGTGGRAAVDAAMAAGYFGKLAKAGFDFESALKIVNSTLSVKSVYESLSTIDVVNIDLFTGQAEFFKAGAAISFVRKNGKCYIVESASLPTGILREVSFATDKFTVCSGDIIVLVSDGVTEHGTSWIANEIENWKYDNPQKLSQKIASMATEKADNGKHDDITVVSLLVS